MASRAAKEDKTLDQVQKSGGLVTVIRRKRNGLIKCRVADCEHRPFKSERGENVHFTRMHKFDANAASPRVLTSAKAILREYADSVNETPPQRQDSVNTLLTIKSTHANTFIGVQKMWVERASNATAPEVRAAIIECLLDLIREFRT